MIKTKKRGYICGLLVGAVAFGSVGALLANHNVVAETSTTTSANMTSLVSSTTGGAVQATDNGLKVPFVNETTAWQAKLDIRFYDNASITYSLPDFSGFNNNANLTVNSFSVYNYYGEEVARFITGHYHWAVLSESSNAFVYDVAGDQWMTTDGTNIVKKVATDVSSGWSSAPNNIIYKPVANASGCNIPAAKEGTVTFEYKDGKLTVKSTACYKASVDTDIEFTVGEVNVDLSDGYTISMGKAPDIGEYSYPKSSSVVISAINGFSTKGTTATVTGEQEDIFYASESPLADDDKSLILLNEGGKLNKFDYYKRAVWTDSEKTLLIGATPTAKFSYTGNLSATENSDITVSYQNATKNYYVQYGDVSSVDVDVEKLIGNKTTKVNLTKQASLTWGKENYVLKGLQVKNSSSEEAWSAQIGGTFKDTSSISYVLTEQFGSNNNVVANAFTVKDKNKKVVAVFVVGHKEWGNDFNVGAYVYNPETGKYTAQKSSWNNYSTISNYKGPEYNGIMELTVKPSKDISSDKDIVIGFPFFDGEVWSSYSYITSIGNQHFEQYYDSKEKAETNSSTNYIANGRDGKITFAYDKDNKTLTLQTKTVDIGGRDGIVDEIVPGNGQTITVGVIENVDLDDGYTITVGSAPDVTLSDGETFKYPFSSSMIITAINGVDMSGATVDGTATTSITTKNKVENGEIVLSKGEELSFTSNSVVNVGTLTLDGVASVKKNVFGSYENYGDRAVVTVRDGYTVKDFDVRVKGLTEELSGVEMEKGAEIRAIDPKGLRFTMSISGADIATITENVGEGKAYASVRYGMMILPYSYLTAHGDITVKNVFGESAIYGWNGEEGKTQIMLRYSDDNKLYEGGEGSKALMFAITGLEGKAAWEMKFVGAGFIELTKANGEKEYKLVTKHEGYNESAETNDTCVWSFYDVAKVVLADDTLDDEVKTWLQDIVDTVGGNISTEGEN